MDTFKANGSASQNDSNQPKKDEKQHDKHETPKDKDSHKS